MDILHFMQQAYELDDAGKRKLRFLYTHSGIETRYSAIPDFNGAAAAQLFLSQGQAKRAVSLERRMEVYDRMSVQLSVQAIKDCIRNFIEPAGITHLVTVSCTGMSAPGLDLQIMEAMQLSPDIFRTSVNFMGCYAAIHALKLGALICDATPGARVVIVATELCTLHFQYENTEDNAASSLLFADGSAAVLMSGSLYTKDRLSIKGFYSQVAQKGKTDMAWQLGSNGFRMRLSGYVPELIEEDVAELVNKASASYGLLADQISHWCIHPGGKRILDVIEKKLQLPENALASSRKVLKRYGNMSSPTVLFVLKEIMENKDRSPSLLMALAFGPGLTMETFIAAGQ